MPESAGPGNLPAGAHEGRNDWKQVGWRGPAPPIGRLYGLTTLMDESLMRDDHVTFQAGTHTDAVTMSLADFRRVAHAEMAHFARHV